MELLPVFLYLKLSDMDKLILASSSPRRAAILTKFGVPFAVKPSSYEETFTKEHPDIQVLNLSKNKVISLIEANSHLKTSLILGADTCINLDGKIIGKPKSKIEAKAHLLSFSGRTHQVITALTLYNGKTGKYIQEIAVTEVTFIQLSTKEINWYLGTMEWKDVAGSYRIQEKGALLINSISGSWNNVMGLPIRLFYGMVATQGLNLFSI